MHGLKFPFTTWIFPCWIKLGIELSQVNFFSMYLSLQTVAGTRVGSGQTGMEETGSSQFPEAGVGSSTRLTTEQEALDNLCEGTYSSMYCEWYRVLS